jgi:hypothetical protein
MSAATSAASISSVPGCRSAHPGYKATVIASEAKQSIDRRKKRSGLLRCFAPLRKRFAFVAGNDGV